MLPIENSLHWVLDVGFREDDCRIRKDNAPQNLAILRYISLNLLNQEKTSKTGANNKRLRAGWDDDYLSNILAVSVKKKSHKQLIANYYITYKKWF